MSSSRSRTEDIQSTALSFRDLLLPYPLISALEATGFSRPSPVQEAAIPLGRTGIDLVVQAKSGTGKTVVFSVVCLDRLSATVPTPQVN